MLREKVLISHLELFELETWRYRTTCQSKALGFLAFCS